MAIRKDVDDMLNNLKNGKASESPKKNQKNKPESHAVDNIDGLSVDDLLTSIADSTSPSEKAEKAEKKRLEKERIAAEKAEKERLKAERIAAEKTEKERLRAKRIAAEKERHEEENTSAAVLSSAPIKSSEPDENDTGDSKNSSENGSPSLSKKKSQADRSDDTKSESVKKPSGIVSALKKILDEDPDEIVAHRKEQADPDDEAAPRKSFKKGFYAVFGVIFSVLACIGLITVIAKGIDKIGSYSSGDSHKEGFEKFLYPAVIMDIETFNSPSELPSEQIVTAAIWSMIMTKGVTDRYERTFDVVRIPAADVESYAVKLFGEDIPQFHHTTVGPSESRFYYNEETKSYNVPVAPVTYTYSPEIREATKNGDEYTVKVDYIDELPSWLPKTSSKSVEFVLIDNNGGYQLRSMKILATNTNAV